LLATETLLEMGVAPRGNTTERIRAPQIDVSEYKLIVRSGQTERRSCCQKGHCKNKNKDACQ
jgi:hypothetical protein